MNYKNLLKILSICLILVVITIYSLYAYIMDKTPKEIPIIEADTCEVRVKPIDAGGIIIPNSDNVIYENMGKVSTKKKINILPEPEQALPIGLQRNTTSDLDTLIDEMLTNIMEPPVKKQISNSSRITKSIFEDEVFLIENDNNQEPSNSEALIKTLNVVKVLENNKKINKIKSYNIPQKEGYKIQLATMKSASLATSEGERIKKKHQNILNNVTITNKKIQHDKDKFFYIILAGDYPNLSRAKAACKKLSDRSQSCMVYHP